MTYRPADQLLWALSGHRGLDWAHFRGAFEELFADYLADDDADRPEVARFSAALMLDALGHAEAYLSAAPWRIVAAPPVLAELPLPGLPRAVLCGARTPSTAGDVRQAVATVGSQLRLIETQPQNSLAPTVIEFVADSTEQLERLATALNIRRAAYPAALAIAAASAGVNEYVAQLEWSTTPEPNWKRSVFDPRTGRFGFAHRDIPDPRLVRYEHPIAGRRFKLWRGDRSAAVELLWGRYAVLAELQISIVRYDDLTVTALVPRAAPLPRLLARALTLCSGHPSISDPAGDTRNTRYDRFAGVPPDLFNLAVSKLGQNLHQPDPGRRH